MYSDSVSLLLTTTLLSGVVGLFVGSFLNVVIYRTPRGLSVAAPRSFCPTCDRQLLWWENVPVVSWLALRGRCHTCREPISSRYPLVEVVTGASFAATTWALHGTIMAAAYCALAATVIAVGLIEYGDQRPPVVVAGIGTGLAEAIIILSGAWHHHWAAVIGSAVGSVMALVAYGVLRRVDPDGSDPRGHGRGALLPAACWVGGLGPMAAIGGASAGIMAYLACMAGAWALSSQPATVGGTPVGSHRATRLAHPVLETPLVTAVVVAMVAALAVGA
jgi:leader peptidase (prepilin peptidase)/N-methyltransferase